ncbi:MAG: hypothetical protein DMG14_13645 [Acidobacteria bacterium]|nr:MAG: hypothetical protein DMG14_13645 [Acidobacteriota bacterium]
MDLRFRQTALALKHAVGIDGFPRRHLSGYHGRPDLKSMDLRVLIRNQREWSNIAGPVAGLTMLLENSDDLVVERYLALRASLDCANGKDQCKQAKSS